MKKQRFDKVVNMRILGIDPGYAIVGYGAFDYVAGKFNIIDYGSITTEAHTDFNFRLTQIYNDMNIIIEKIKPEAISLEKLFYHSNQTTVIKVAEARGVILLAAAMHNIPVYEYTPLQVKSAVVGYGKAVKSQVMEMTRVLLGLEKVPKPDDTADALAIAICHAHSSSSLLNFNLSGR